jgi:hypothetical protein
MGIASHRKPRHCQPFSLHVPSQGYQTPTPNAKGQMQNPQKNQSNFPVADQLPERRCPNALPKNA